MTNNKKYFALNDEELIEKQSNILSSQKSKREFLETAIDNDQSNFCAWFRQVTVDGQLEHPVLPKMTVSEFLDPPFTTERTIWEQFRKLPTVQASFPGFWYQVCLQAIENHLLFAADFAHDSTSSKDMNGKSSILQILKHSDAVSQKKALDRTVRRILLVMGGLIKERGHRTTFVNCPLAKAWWRHQLTREACRLLESENDSCIKKYSQTFRNNTLWTILIEHQVSRLTVLGFPKARAIAMFNLVRLCQRENDKEVVKKEFQQILQRIGHHCTMRPIELMHRKQLLELANAVFSLPRSTT